MRKASLSISVLVLLAVCVFMLTGGDAMAEEKQYQYVGASKCKVCHKTEAQGGQYGKWEESAHAGAYATLASEASKKIAAEKGIEDAQKADECLQCHVTAHGVAAELKGTKYAAEEGVTCEACHGAGSEYKSKKTMAAITAGEIDGATVGLVRPDAKTCQGCHNEKSPTFKGFDYEKMLAKIAHPIPEARKATYKESGGSK